MNPEKLTTKSREALLVATQLAKEHNHASVLPAHLALALLAQQSGIIYPALDRLEVRPLDLRRELEDLLDQEPKVYGGAEATASPAMSQVLTNADKHRRNLKDDYLSVEHLLLALSEDPEATGDVFRRAGLTATAILEALQSLRGNQRVTSEER